MSLQEKLDAHKARFKAKVPPETAVLMQRATDELRQSGVMDRVLKVGDHAPEFALPNAQGKIINSKDLLADGSLIVSFYRGVW